MMILQRALLLALFALVAACASTDEEFEPAPLVDFKATAKIDKLWSRSVGKGPGDRFQRVRAIIDGGQIIVASVDGKVLAVNRQSGRPVFKFDLERGITGAVGIGAGKILLGLEEGVVAAVDARGRIAWETSVGGEVLAPPAGSDSVVVAQTYDGRLIGLDAKTGKQLWSYAYLVPRLSIRGTSSPLIEGDKVFAGLANGRVVALDLATGTLLWEHRVSVPSGTTVIERLSDVDGEMLVVGNNLYVVGYQGRLMAIDISNGNRLWSRDASSTTGPSASFGNVYVAATDGSVTAFRRSGAAVEWTQTILARRQLARSASLNKTLVLADHEGYLHFLSEVDGSMVARTRVDRDGVLSPLLSKDNILYVYTNSGDLVAYRLKGGSVLKDSTSAAWDPSIGPAPEAATEVLVKAEAEAAKDKSDAEAEASSSAAEAETSAPAKAEKQSPGTGFWGRGDAVKTSP